MKTTGHTTTSLTFKGIDPLAVISGPRTCSRPEGTQVEVTEKDGELVARIPGTFFTVAVDFTDIEI